MSTLLVITNIVLLLSALTIIGLVLIQHGKGADMGAAFGSGASGSLFGATGSSNFLSKSTGIAAAIFFCATLVLAFFGTRHATIGGGVIENLPTAPVTSPAPAAQPGTAASAPAASSAAAAVSNAPAAASAGASAPSAGTPASGTQSSQIPK